MGVWAHRTAVPSTMLRAKSVTQGPPFGTLITAPAVGHSVRPARLAFLPPRPSARSLCDGKTTTLPLQAPAAPVVGYGLMIPSMRKEVGCNDTFRSTN